MRSHSGCRFSRPPHNGVYGSRGSRSSPAIRPRQTLKPELLHPTAGTDFRGVKVSLRIGSDVVEALKLSRAASAAPERSDNVQRPAVDNHDLSVVEVGHVHE